jgi:UDP-MurNAc hydroxylase
LRLRYIYSACVVIDTPDIRILCDPWFTPGAYDGSWFQWPPIEHPIESIGPADLIYVSHIHPDHYDPTFLRRYLDRFPGAMIVIGAQTPPILERKLATDGFSFQIVDRLSVGRTELAILPNRSRAVNVDTALVVSRDGQSIANLNDNPFDDRQVEAIRELCGGSPSLALLPYGGATNHPQTFLFPSEHELLAAARTKERHFLDIFHQYIAALEPAAVLPFAGKYWLGGPLARLNPYRGMPDPLQAADEAGDCAFVLADGGQAFFDLDTMSASDVRTEAYDLSQVQISLCPADFPGYAYEREIRLDSEHAIPLVPLLNSALRSARRRIVVTEPYWVCIQPSQLGVFLCFDPSGTNDVKVIAEASQLAELSPRAEIFIDDRYLFGLLTRLYHWNNAMIGSHYLTRRTPDIFRRDVADFFDYLQV